MRSFFRGILCGVAIAGSAIFLRISAAAPLEALAHLEDIIMGRYELPQINDNIIVAFFLFALVIAILSLAVTPPGNKPEDIV